MRYWKYKAYDCDGIVSDGVAAGNDHITVILELRQSGLQVYEISTISITEYNKRMAEDDRVKRLLRLQARLQPAREPTHEPIRKSGHNNQAQWWYALVIANIMLAIIIILLLIK